MIKLLLLFVLLSGISCSRLYRNLASAQPQYSFKLYSTTKYLPQKVLIFKRNYTYSGEIHVAPNRSLMAGESLKCVTSSFAANSSFAEEIYTFIGPGILPLKPELNTVTCEIIKPEKSLELLVEYRPQSSSEFDRLEAMINVLRIEDLKFREMEPSSNLCEAEQITGKKNFVITAKMTHGSVGEFCGTPIELSAGLLAAACDANRDETWNGFVNIFNDKMLLIKKTKILSPKHDQDGFEWTNSVDHVSVPLAINKQAIFVTNDGRILYFNTEGTKIHELKMPFLYLSNPQMIDESLDSFAILGADSISNPDHKAILIIKNNRLIKTVDLNSLNEISSFQVFSDEIYVVTMLGEILKLDWEGQILNQIQVEKNRLSPLLIQENRLLVGSDSGRFYELDRELKTSKMLYRAFYSGNIDFDVGTGKDYAVRPNLTFAPIILKNGKIVIASENDGRIHFLDEKGKLEKIVTVPFVRDLLGVGLFTTADGEEYISASSISYLEILNTRGDIVAESISTGAEIFDHPHRLTQSLAPLNNHFMMGMYNGVFRFRLDSVPGKNITTKIVRPCP